jgi:hypothetical protein
MLRIRIELVSPGGRVRTVALAEVGNVSDMAPISNYKIRALENADPEFGGEAWHDTGYVDGHDRSAPCWRLIERVAKWAADSIDNRYRPSVKP